MEKKRKKILLEGEAMNHVHVLVGDYEEISSDEFLVRDAYLSHENKVTGEKAEHEAIKLEKGKAVLGQQVQYNPFKEEVRKMLD